MDDQTKIVDLRGCARCHGDGHEGLEFHKLKHPVMIEGQAAITHWAKCPTTGEPILMQMVSTDPTEATPLVDLGALVRVWNDQVWHVVCIAIAAILAGH